MNTRITCNHKPTISYSIAGNAKYIRCECGRVTQAVHDPVNLSHKRVEIALVRLRGAL